METIQFQSRTSMPTGIDSLSHQQHLHHHHNYNYRPPHHYKSTIHLVTTARDFNDEDERRRSSSYKVNNEINSSNIANYIKNQSNSSHAYSQQYHSSLSHRPVNNTYSSTRTNSSLSRHSSNLTKTTAAAALAMLLKGHADTSSSSNLLDITDQQQTRATPNRRRGSIITDSILTKNDQCKQQTKSSYSSLVTLNRTNQTVSTQVAAPSIRRCVSVLGKRYSSTDLNIPKPNTARVEKSSSLRSTNQDLNERETLNNSKSRISLDSNGSLSARISNYQQQLPLNMRRNHVLSQSKSNSSMILNDSAMNKMKGERLHDTSLTQSNSENTIKANEQEYVKNSVTNIAKPDVPPKVCSLDQNKSLLKEKRILHSKHLTRQHSHEPCPITYQSQLSLGTTTTSDSGSDNTILNHLPEQNEVSDKSQSSVLEEILNNGNLLSPRKNPVKHSNRLRSCDTVTSDELEKNSRKLPPLVFSVSSVKINNEVPLNSSNSDSELRKLEREIYEERKKKIEEQEQVVINVTEYAQDILKYLHEREHVCRPKANYMRKQRELTWEMRAILIDWLCEVADEYKLFSETFHLAVNFIDRFLSRMSVTKSKFQLIGTAALYLAAKCEEVYPPNASEFAYVTDNAYSKKQVLKIEDLLLKTLHFEVSTVTTHTFLLHYMKLIEIDEITEDLAKYIADITLLDSECIQQIPSLQAAAILCLSLHMNKKPAWSYKLKEYTGYTINSFYSIMEKIFWNFARTTTQGKWAITKKYRHMKHHNVASIELPTTLPYTMINEA